MKSFKRTIERIWKILTGQKWAAAALGVVVIYLLGIFWYGTLEAAGSGSNSVRSLREQMELSQKREVRYYEDGAYLIDGQGKVLCGPYQMIFEDWKVPSDNLAERDSYNEETLTRFLSMSGYYGYLTVSDGGEVLTAVYTEAEPMSLSEEEATQEALVCDGTEYYRIDSEGNRLTEGHYQRWIPLYNGYFCGKLVGERTWSLLSEDETVLLDGCQSIVPPEQGSSYGTALRDGKLLLLYGKLSAKDPEIRIIEEYDGMEKIEFYEDEGYAIVKNSDGQYGVIALEDGKILLQDQYTAITCEAVRTREDSGQSGMALLFIGKKTNGTIETIQWKKGE